MFHVRSIFGATLYSASLVGLLVTLCNAALHHSISVSD